MQDEADELTSKTRKKKDMLALQDLGVQLVELSEQQLETMQLPESLLAAVQEHMEKQGMKIERHSEAMKAVLAKKGNEDLREKWLRIQQ